MGMLCVFHSALHPNFSSILSGEVFYVGLQKDLASVCSVIPSVEPLSFDIKRLFAVLYIWLVLNQKY
jgi:hypothetical protein